MESPALFAFMLTLLAGLATGIGALMAFFTERTNTKFLSASLGFSAGVMLYISFVEMLPHGRAVLAENWGETLGHWGAVLAFFGGILLIGLIDKLVPEYQNPHHPRSVEQVECGHAELPDGPGHDFAKLRSTGIMMALAIGIHNFPEGIATFTAAYADPTLGIAIAVAIAIHNIPEGIAIAIPLYYATGDRKKSFVYSLVSGLAEPLGALCGYFLLLPFFTPAVFGVLIAGVAGIMVFISLDELLPAAVEYEEHHLCTYGVVAGMAVMAASLILLQ